MKLLVATGLLLVGFSGLAQSSRMATTNTEINDDGKVYSIRVDGQRNGKVIQYQRTFDVSNMDKEQKEALKNRVLDSLGLGESAPAPALPGKGVPSGMQPVTFTCPACTGKTKLSISGNGFSTVHEVETDTDKSTFPFDLTMPPGTYQYVYEQNGVKQIPLSFTVKSGQKNTVRLK